MRAVSLKKLRHLYLKKSQGNLTQREYSQYEAMKRHFNLTDQQIGDETNEFILKRMSTFKMITFIMGLIFSMLIIKRPSAKDWHH